ncbi:MAG: metallophosphoesterase family protein [Planctomycetota bacterium]|jgi:hypothetical protein
MPRANRRFSILVVLVVIFTFLCGPGGGVVLAETRFGVGENLLSGAKWQYAIADDRNFTSEPPRLTKGKEHHILARAEFKVSEIEEFVALELTHGLNLTPDFVANFSFSLNGKPIRLPIEGMSYKTIPGIDPGLLVKGGNVLTGDLSVRNVSKKHADRPFKLDVRFVAFGEDFFTVTHRTNVPVSPMGWSIKLSDGTSSKIVASSTSGLIHRFLVPRQKLDSGLEYWFHYQSPSRSATSAPVTFTSRKWSINAQWASPKFRFVALGDSRTQPQEWAKVSAAVVREKPAVVLFSGDMVTDGWRNWEWDEEFFGVAEDLFATIPFYPVIGNHEKDVPLYDELFYTPAHGGRGRNWVQCIGDVMLIGIDGGFRADFSPNSKNAQWLETQLAHGRNARFIFLVTHYPAWSSGKHGELGDDSRPREHTSRQARELVAPLLVKYNATAMIAGHDHFYERSEPPGGVTHIITGGGGAPLRKKSENPTEQNPYSKAFASELHYCLFEVDGDVCTAKAITTEGKLLDSKTWSARKDRLGAIIGPHRTSEKELVAQ